jgi:integrase
MCGGESWGFNKDIFKRAGDFIGRWVDAETELHILFQCSEFPLSLFDRDGKRKYLNVAERLRFFRSVHKVDCPAERSFLLTLIYTGCRISEALNLRPGDIDFSEKIVVFRTLKQRNFVRYRAIPGSGFFSVKTLKFIGAG